MYIQQKGDEIVTRMTHEKVSPDGTVGYWTPHSKNELIDQLASYEDLGMTPQDVRKMIELTKTRNRMHNKLLIGITVFMALQTIVSACLLDSDGYVFTVFMVVGFAWLILFVHANSEWIKRNVTKVY